MSDEKKKPTHPAHSTEAERDVRGIPETNFLPPLKMVLAFLDQDEKDKETKQESSDERNVEKLIEKLSEKEDE
jgi:hypothetical protein